MAGTLSIVSIAFILDILNQVGTRENSVKSASVRRVQSKDVQSLNFIHKVTLSQIR